MPGPLEHSPADVLRRLLIDKGAGTDPAAKKAWPVFAAGEPDAPDSAITVYDTEGRLQGRTHPDGDTAEFHGVQVRVRAAGHSAGYAKARAIAVLLDRNVRMSTQSIGANHYVVQGIHRTSDVLSLGKEAPPTKRSLFTINAVVTIRQAA